MHRFARRRAPWTAPARCGATAPGLAREAGQRGRARRPAPTTRRAPGPSVGLRMESASRRPPRPASRHVLFLC